MSSEIDLTGEAEYSALRNEVLKRLELRYQTIRLTLIIAGIFLTLGLRDEISERVLLVYPILALFLATSWIHHGFAISRLGKYIREELEPKLNMGWETFLKESDPPYFGKFGKISSVGLFLLTQILSLGFALSNIKFGIFESVLLLTSIIAMIITVALFHYYVWSDPYKL